jgi:hypothetical protein
VTITGAGADGYELAVLAARHLAAAGDAAGDAARDAAG